jgi:hypothetical protein
MNGREGACIDFELIIGWLGGFLFLSREGNGCEFFSAWVCRLLVCLALSIHLCIRSCPHLYLNALLPVCITAEIDVFVCPSLVEKVVVEELTREYAMMKHQMLLFVSRTQCLRIRFLLDYARLTARRSKQAAGARLEMLQGLSKRSCMVS